MRMLPQKSGGQKSNSKSKQERLLVPPNKLWIFTLPCHGEGAHTESHFELAPSCPSDLPGNWGNETQKTVGGFCCI